MPSETNDTSRREARRLLRVLEATNEKARHAALTGALKSGEPRCIQQYNAVLGRLRELDMGPKGLAGELLMELNEGISFDEIAAATSVFASYLRCRVGDEETTCDRCKKRQSSSELSDAAHLLEGAS